MRLSSLILFGALCCAAMPARAAGVQLINVPPDSTGAALTGAVWSPCAARLAPNAGHFSFLAPCSPAHARAIPRICVDAPGFDRAAFHREFNAEVLAFFGKHLVGAGKP